MKTIKKYYSKEEFNEMFFYRNGNLFWAKPRGTKRIGDPAGRVDGKGYFRVSINQKEFRRSRIVYIMHYGNIPAGMLIDHKNEVKGDDRIKNLRICNNSQNKNNTKKRSDNKSGFKGVSWKKAAKKWQVSILVNGENKYIGLFKKKIEAASAYKKAATKYHKQFAKY